MKNFNELFEEARATSDRRKQVFSQLAENLKGYVLPNFLKVLKGYDIKEARFELSHRPISNMSSNTDQYGCEYYLLGIDSEGVFTNYQQNLVTDRMSVVERYNILGFTYNDNDIVGRELLRCGLVELTKAINERIDNLNKLYSERSDTALGLIQ